MKIEVVTFGPGLHMLRDDTSPVKARIEVMALSSLEISFKACGNTKRTWAENKDIPIIPQAQVVKSGVVRVMELEEQGWTYVKPVSSQCRTESEIAQESLGGSRPPEEGTPFLTIESIQQAPRLVKCGGGTTNHLVGKMQRRDLKSMSADQLWNLHEELVAELSRKIAAEKNRLDERLHKLGPADDRLKHERRPYPKVLPKYRNPKNSAETWAGRGKQPRWLRAQLRSGKKLDDFRIERLASV